MMNQCAFVSCLLVIALVYSNLKSVVADGNTNFQFTKHLYNVSIPENSIAKTYATQTPGSDLMGIHLPPDTFYDIRYKIVEGDKDKFFKTEHRIVGDFCFLFIRIKTGNNDVLNRERRDKYNLQVRASAFLKEGKQKVQFTTDTTVAVTVTDTNDLNPLFYPTEYNATVFEDTPVHQSILRVVAEDADLGRNGEIYYSFIEDTEKFMIHPITGIISLTRPLRYNEGSYHELTVYAQDRGASTKSGFGMFSKAKVRIRVQKVNFHAPEIKIRRHPEIVENSNADIYAIVNVADKDTGIHGEIASLEIVDGDPDGHFRIRPTKQPGEYNIEVLKLLDRETAPNGYILQLRAVDKGIPPKESYKSVHVILADFNDNAPVFNKEIYDIKVPESAPVNTPLIRLKVTDADEGKNAQVYLEIVGGNEGGEFSINSETGMLYTAVPLDAENKQFYSLTVSAIDQGNVATRKQSSAKIKIYVEDTNDNDPIFEKAEAVVWIDENMPAGASVTTVHAKDKDRGENAYISYLIANLNKVPFEIDHFSGIIKTTMLLDYESMRREYVLRVRASDWGLPYRRQTEMQLTVKVKDINDNRPQFERVDCFGHIPRNMPIGSEIITLSAIDFDAETLIEYRIVSGNEDGCFSIDATSGTISVSCDLNDIKVGERELNVTATDNTHFADIARVRFKFVNGKRKVSANGKSFSDELEQFDCRDTGVARKLTEILADAEHNNKPSTQEEFPMMPTRYGLNVHSPEFLDFPVEIKVNESVALGTTLIKLRARDRDLGYNGKLLFGISSGDLRSQFCIDMETGELKVIGYLDRERDSIYFLNISVYDLGKPQKSWSRILPITVLDVNDNPPRFEKTLASFRVTENALNGTAIFRANATDADEGDNAKITYSLVTDTKDFSIDPTNGVLTVSNALDRERQDLYELKIRATDGGGKGPENPPLYSEALVRISIDDINDNPPKFSLPNYLVKIREDVPKGTVVAVISASDPDLGSEGEIMYSLEDSDNEKAFKIDNSSGTIRTTKLLDFEERQVHSLVVYAKDKGNPSLSSEASVTINVVDVNENMHAPQFGDFVLSGKVMENLPVGSFVMQVNATDADPPGGDSTIEYSIRGGDGIGIFSVDNKGSIRTLAVLDIETKSHYWITVFAQDHGIIPLVSSVEVYIEVLNENDNVPLSEEAVYYTNIPEESPEGTTVLQIRATDRDKDPNQKITYKISTGNPEGLFAINSSTGLDLHFWRKCCKICKCSKEEHQVQDDDIYGWAQFQLLGSKPNKIKTKIVLPGKKDEIDLDWVPKGHNDTVEKYLKTLPPEQLPVKGSQAAQDRKQLLQKQIPIHDIDPTLCHELTEDELEKMKEYIAHVKQTSAGVGQLVSLSSIIRGKLHMLSPSEAAILASRYSKGIPVSEIVKLQSQNKAGSLAHNLDKMSLKHKTLPQYNPNSLNESEDVSNPLSYTKVHDREYPMYNNDINTNAPNAQFSTSLGPKQFNINPSNAQINPVIDPTIDPKYLQNPNFNSKNRPSNFVNPNSVYNQGIHRENAPFVNNPLDYNSENSAFVPYQKVSSTSKPGDVYTENSSVTDPRYAKSIPGQSKGAPFNMNPSQGEVENNAQIYENLQDLQKPSANMPNYAAGKYNTYSDTQSPVKMPKNVKDLAYSTYNTDTHGSKDIEDQENGFSFGKYRQPGSYSDNISKNNAGFRPIESGNVSSSQHFNPANPAQLLKPGDRKDTRDRGAYSAQFETINPHSSLSHSTGTRSGNTGGYSSPIQPNISSRSYPGLKVEDVAKHDAQYEPAIATNVRPGGFREYNTTLDPNSSYASSIAETSENAPSVNYAFDPNNPNYVYPHSEHLAGMTPGLSDPLNPKSGAFRPTGNSGLSRETSGHNHSVGSMDQSLGYQKAPGMQSSLEAGPGGVLLPNNLLKSDKKLSELHPSDLRINEDFVNPSQVNVGLIQDINYPEIKTASREVDDFYEEYSPDSIKEILNNVILPDCHYCKKPFEENEFAVSIDRANVLFHAGCFKCAGCNQILADNMYFYNKESDNIYCLRDYAKIRGLPRCKACDELIFTKEYCLAENSTFHLKHFCCTQCDMPLAGQDYLLEDEMPYCLPCFEQNKASKCSACGKIIKPDEVGCNLRGVHFHATDACFACKVCKTPLTGKKLLLRNDQLYCSHECYGKDQ